MIEPSDGLLARWVSAVLLVGTSVSIGVVLVGVVLTQLASPPAAPVAGGLLAQIAAFKPGSIVSLGLLLLVLTPVAVLVAALVAFIRSGEHRYVAITSLVLGLLVVGVLAASLVSRGVGG